MSKESSKETNAKRRRMTAQFAERRAKLKAIDTRQSTSVIVGTALCC